MATKPWPNFHILCFFFLFTTHFSCFEDNSPSPFIKIFFYLRGGWWETLSPPPAGSRKTKMPKLIGAKVPLFAEEGGLFFRVSAVCDVPSLHSIFYAPISESIVPKWVAQYQNNHWWYYRKGMLWHYEVVRRQHTFYPHC